MSIVIDATTYNVPVKVINRKADMLYRFAERTQDGVLHSELIGVYYNYDVQCGMSATNVADYAALWIKLSEAVVTHSVVMPTESGTQTLNAYFANIKDEVVKQKGATNYFRNLSFSIIAISPALTP